jgi:hypothetical protein
MPVVELVLRGKQLCHHAVEHPIHENSTCIVVYLFITPHWHHGPVGMSGCSLMFEALATSTVSTYQFDIMYFHSSFAMKPLWNLMQASSRHTLLCCCCCALVGHMAQLLQRNWHSSEGTSHAYLYL